MLDYEVNTKSKYIIGWGYSSPGQSAALLLCNAIGREAVAKAYFGDTDDYLALVQLFKEYTGKDFDDLLGAAVEFTGYDSHSGPNQKITTTAAGKTYMNLILEVCTARAADPAEHAALRAELGTLIKYSPVIYDEAYMEYYYGALTSLRDGLK